MSRKPVVPRQQANQDVEHAVDYYVSEAGEAVALRFIGALEKSYGAIASQPATGSPRYAFELNLPGLRTWQVKGFPYLIFYAEDDRHIDIWRVLHAQRDIAAWMNGSAADET